MPDDGNATGPRRPRQPAIPGTRDKKSSKVHNLALEVAELTDQRMTVHNQEKEARRNLINAMHAAELEEYRHGEVVVKLVESKEKVRVKIDSDEDD